MTTAIKRPWSSSQLAHISADCEHLQDQVDLEGLERYDTKDETVFPEKRLHGVLFSLLKDSSPGKQHNAEHVNKVIKDLEYNENLYIALCDMRPDASYNVDEKDFKCSQSVRKLAFVWIFHFRNGIVYDVEDKNDVTLGNIDNVRVDWTKSIGSDLQNA